MKADMKRHSDKEMVVRFLSFQRSQQSFILLDNVNKSVSFDF